MNKKEMQVLRSECATLEVKNKEITNEVLKEILEDIANLDKDFRKLSEMDNNEVKFLQQQMFQLTQEKTKIQQSVVMLDSRTANVENDVGFE
jgi:predicted  nucleic acid-binding Zn-ribbon protein